MQGDGKIVAAGVTVTVTQSAFALARYNPDGSLDPTFGFGGAGDDSSHRDTSVEEANAVAVQGDGKIVAAGFTTIVRPFRFRARALQPGRRTDPTFGSGGAVTTTIGTSDEDANAVAVQGDGKIVAAGVTSTGTSSPLSRSRATTRTAASTRPSASGGTVTTAFGTSVEEANAVAVQGDGKIVAAGFTRTGHPSPLSPRPRFRARALQTRTAASTRPSARVAR